MSTRTRITEVVTHAGASFRVGERIASIEEGPEGFVALYRYWASEGRALIPFERVRYTFHGFPKAEDSA